MSEFHVDDSQDVGLLYRFGTPELDLHDLDTALVLGDDGHPRRVVEASRESIGVYSGTQYETLSTDRTGGHPLSEKPLSLAEIAAAARQCGVTYVRPTAHAKGTDALAEIAWLLGLNYPSPEFVNNLEDKRTFHAILGAAAKAGACMVLPETIQARSAEDIALAAQAIGKVVFAKIAKNSHSGLGSITIDGSRPLSPEDLQNINEHVSLRAALGLDEGGSIVQERFGDAEWGFQTMFEVSRKGIDIFWHMSTRKIVQPSNGRIVAHIHDPEDKERIAITQDVLLPTVKEMLPALLEGTPDRRATKGRQYTLNADLLTERGMHCFPPDASARTMPFIGQAANATIGLSAESGRFPELMRWWAQGRKIPREALRLPEHLDPRAIIMGKAFTATGGTVVRDESDTTAGTDPDYFHAQFPRLSTVLPGPFEGSAKPVIGAFPLICTEGRDIEEAQRNFTDTLRTAKIAVKRDGERYRWESERPFKDYYA